jgi:HlyD family secretion protein
MKKITVIIGFVLTATLFWSCEENGEKSDAYGNFEATEITISAQTAGQLLRFDVDEGDFLKAGDYVGYVDTTDLVLKKQQLEARIKAVKAKFVDLDAQVTVLKQELNNAVIDKDRIIKMFNDNAATQKQVDDIRGKVNVIKKKIKSVEAGKVAVNAELEVIHRQIDEVEESIKKAVIINPVNGTVLTKYAEIYEMAAMGKPLYKIADLRRMKLKVYVSGAQLPDIKIGQEVEVIVDKDKTTNRKLKGKVSWISEAAEFTPKIIQTKEERVNLVYAVKVLVENDGTLKIGMPGEANF